MITIGEFQITRVEDLVIGEDPSLLKHWNDDALRENRAWMMPNFYDEGSDTFRVVIQTWTLRTPDRTIVIDTSGGNDKERPLSPRFHKLATGFPERLAAAGIEPDKVDMVILSHLHTDHVGWNTRLQDGQWVPMFPNASYVMSATELAARSARSSGYQRDSSRRRTSRLLG